jgi:hypothetical protein
VLVTGRGPRGEAQTGASNGSRENRSASVGDSTQSTASATPATGPQGYKASRPSRPLPEKPFPNQRQPPCTPLVETALRGACWVALDVKPPCGNDAYEWEGKCYIPAISTARQPTSNPPQ